MESGGNAALGLIGLWMLLQLVVFLALLIGGIYALFCMGRAAAGLDRLASAVEDLVERQNQAGGGAGDPGMTLRGATYGSAPVPTATMPAPVPASVQPSVSSVVAPVSERNEVVPPVATYPTTPIYQESQS